MLSTRTIVAGALVLTVSGCTLNIPGKIVPSTGPVDVQRRINTVGKEAIGESCQWWFSAGALGYFVEIPLPMKGNQNYLAVENAIGSEYDGLIGATMDQRITPYGLAIPTSADFNPQNWVHIFVTPKCQEIRGTPYVYTEKLSGSN